MDATELVIAFQNFCMFKINEYLNNRKKMKQYINKYCVFPTSEAVSAHTVIGQVDPA